MVKAHGGGMQRAGLLTIGMFARLSWLSQRALRLYEAQGLLVPAVVDEQTGYRWYRPEQLEVARLVARLRRLQMPLARIAEVVGAPDPHTAVELLEQFWAGEEFRLAARRELVGHLRFRLAGQEGGLDVFDVQVREVPEQLVLTEQRHTRVQELGPWIDEAMARLLKAATGHGDGMAGPCFIVFHGEVNEESDGPVEICLPISPATDRPVDGAVRIEPAHREAYTRITKAQCAFPQILSAFDAVRLWTEREGRPVTGSPREVYFGDLPHAAPQDEVCDIAQPIA
jgi:DNA-binding transcriptional MerR regulator